MRDRLRPLLSKMHKSILIGLDELIKSPSDGHEFPLEQGLSEKTKEALIADTQRQQDALIQSQVDDLAGGDIFLICSEGLSDLVQDDEIREALLTGLSSGCVAIWWVWRCSEAAMTISRSSPRR